jgi:hypothetical protein
VKLLTRHRRRKRAEPVDHTPEPAPPSPLDGAIPIGEVAWRKRVKVFGRVRSVRVRPWADVPTLECVLVDDTGGLTVVFLGRRSVAGIRPGTRMAVEGLAGAHHGNLAMLNPDYTLVG